MQLYARPMALGALLIFGMTLGARAQDQPAAGSPPPSAAAQAPTQTQQAPAQAEQAPDQDDAIPPPIDAPRGANRQWQVRVLVQNLGLTPEQRAEIQPILVNRRQQLQRARADATLGPQDRKALIKELNQDSVRKINAVLTDAQRQEYKQLRQELRAKGQQPMVQPPANNQQ